jgi:hypothetical protein
VRISNVVISVILFNKCESIPLNFKMIVIFNLFSLLSQFRFKDMSRPEENLRNIFSELMVPN